jgi:hypothetical protein
MMMGIGDLQFNINSKPHWGPGIPHIHKAYALSEVREGVGTKKYSHWTWPGLNLQPSAQDASTLSQDHQVIVLNRDEYRTFC